jgi:hypothetical protein
VISAGHSPISSITCDLRDAVSATRPVMENLEHEVSLDLPDEPLTVEGDRIGC